jgi:hypothetical protein
MSKFLRAASFGGFIALSAQAHAGTVYTTHELDGQTPTRVHDLFGLATPPMIDRFSCERREPAIC